MFIQRLRKLMKIAKEPGYWRALSRGVAAAAEHQPVLSQLDCRLILDVGANRGQFALVARRCFPSARIHCFEPLPGPWRKLSELTAGDERIVCHQYAIGPASETRDIHISARDDSSSLLPITASQNAIFPGTAEVGLEKIEVRPMSSFFSREDIAQGDVLLKIDVQGFEYEVLQSCAPFLDLIDNIYVECSFCELYGGQKLAGDVIGFLDGAGFSISGMFNPLYDRDGRAIQADFLFRKRREAPGVHDIARVSVV